jgi:hypothetical protein
VLLCFQIAIAAASLPLYIPSSTLSLSGAFLLFAPAIVGNGAVIAQILAYRIKSKNIESNLIALKCEYCIVFMQRE